MSVLENNVAASIIKELNDKAMQFIGHLLYDHIPTDDLSKCSRCLEAKAMHDAYIKAKPTETGK